MEFILVIGIFEALFLAALIFSQKEKSLFDNILGAFFFLYAVNFLLSYIEFYNRANDFPFPAFIGVAPPLILLHGPALWFYIKALTDQNFRFRVIYLLHFVPFIIMVVVTWGSIYSLPAQERINLITSGDITEKMTYKVFVVAIALSTIGYFSWGIQMVRSYRKKLKTYFSDIGNFDLSWLRILLSASLSVYTVINSIYIIDLFIPVASFGTMQFFSFVLGAVYIVFLGFFGLRQGNLFATHRINLNLEKALEDHHSWEKRLDNKEEVFIRKLLDYMKEEKPYLNPDLNIAKLSKMLDVTPEYLSKVINTRLNKNFFDFVNRHRVDEFKEKCRDVNNKNLTIIGLAYDCGFNSKATFNRVFKNVVGSTPSEYVKNQ
jgi:AraC-like DNA-binding protein